MKKRKDLPVPQKLDDTRINGRDVERYGFMVPDIEVKLRTLAEVES